MDSSLRFDTVGRLRDDNFHVSKTRTQLSLSPKDLHTHPTDDPLDLIFSLHAAWQKADSKARGFIALTVFDLHLEQVQYATTVEHMWKLICDLFKKQTLLNKVAACRRF